MHWQGSVGSSQGEQTKSTERHLSWPRNLGFRTLFGHRHGPLALKAALYPAPLGEPPKHETEKERSAEIHTGGIAKLVSNSRVVHRINRDVMTDEQVRHGHRHERPLKHAAAKSRRLLVFFQSSFDAIQQPADYERDEE